MIASRKHTLVLAAFALLATAGLLYLSHHARNAAPSPSATATATADAVPATGAAAQPPASMAAPASLADADASPRTGTEASRHGPAASASADSAPTTAAVDDDNEPLTDEELAHGDGIPTEEWAVRVRPGVDPQALAQDLGAVYKGPVGSLQGIHLLRIPGSARGAEQQTAQAILEADPRITWVGHQKKRARSLTLLEDFLPPEFADPTFPDQWHLYNDGQSGGTAGIDLNVVWRWNEGVTGEGVVIGVVDTGAEHDHPDLADAYRSSLSFDFEDEDADPYPDSGNESHGTAVAGLAVARANEACGVGVAHMADFASLRILSSNSGNLTDATEAGALSFQRDQIDIYTSSWGPSTTNGARFKGPDTLAQQALLEGVTLGRGGLGNIFFFSAGNGHEVQNRVDYNGYANSPYTIAVGAVDHNGAETDYSEHGSALFICAPSNNNDVGVTTSDQQGNSGYSDGDCTGGFTGTSASTPMLAGLAALMLQANPDLTWRDVQYILKESAIQINPDHESWKYNHAGTPFSTAFGFGLADAATAIALARNWDGVPEQIQYHYDAPLENVSIPDNDPAGIVARHMVNQAITVEAVEVEVHLTHLNWGQLQISLISPRGTESILAEPHNDQIRAYSSWKFTTLANWGENGGGEWRLKIIDTATGNSGVFKSWSLTLHGTEIQPETNEPPEAQADTFTLKNFPAIITPLANDDDPDGDNANLEIISLTQPAHGVVYFDFLGKLNYNWDGDESRNDQFTYTIKDENGRVARSKVDIIIPLPLARDDRSGVLQTETIILYPLDNDYDADDDPLEITAVTQPTRGEVSIRPDKTSLEFVPYEFAETDYTFTYTISDGDDGEDTAQFTMLVSESGNFGLEFDGDDDYVDIGAPAALNLTEELTLEAWIYPTGWGEHVTGFGRIFDKGNILLFLNGDGHAFYNNHCLIFSMTDAAGTQHVVTTPPNSIRLNTWQHVAVTYNGNRTRLYINASRQGTSSPSQAGGEPSGDILDNSSEPLYIGESQSGERAFEGFIDEVRIWNIERLDDDILADVNTSLQGNETGLVAYYNMEEANRYTLHDQTLNGHDGAINGALWAYGAVMDAEFTSISPPSREWGHNGGSYYFNITTNTDWTAYTEDDWITLRETAGTVSGRLNYTVAPNQSTEPRVGTIFVNNQTFTIYQDGMPLFVTFDPDSATFPSEGGEGTANVLSNDDFWTASTPDDDWIELTGSTEGSENGSVPYFVRANPWAFERIGEIWIGEADATFTITQEAAPPNTSLVPESLDFNYNGGVGSFTVNSNEDWTGSILPPEDNPEADTSWITLLFGQQGLGTGTVEYIVESNPIPVPRKARISVNGTIHTITQEGAPPFTTISPFELNHPYDGGQGTINIQSNINWSASETSDWISLDGGFGGPVVGALNGQVTYTVAANPLASQRSAIILVNDKQHIVIQAPAPPSVSINPASAEHPATGGTGTLEVTANTAWTTRSQAFWIVITSGSSGSGDGNVTYLVQAQQGTEPRTGTLSVGTQTYTITQEGADPFLSIQPESTQVNWESAVDSFTIDTNLDWDATTSAEWVALQNISGQGDGSISFTVQSNPGPEVRAATISINDGAATYTITQAGKPTTSITQTSFSFAATGGEGVVDVTSNTTWQSSSSAEWVEILTGASGEDDGAVSFIVAPNETVNERAATLTIGGNSCEIIQEGAEPFWSIDPASRNFPAEGGAFTIDVSSNTLWNPVPSAAWIVITDYTGQGDGSISYTVAANEAYEERNGSITLEGNVHLVTQEANPFDTIWTVLQWFGGFDDFQAPLLWTSELGWMYSESETDASVLLFSYDIPELGWFWTSSSAYPWMWSFQVDDWVYYYEQTGNTFGGWFFSNQQGENVWLGN